MFRSFNFQKESKTQREKRLRKRREWESKRRERIREDPERYATYCENERKRHAKRVRQGKVKQAAHLTDRERRKRRRYERERKRAWRSKKRVENNNNAYGESSSCNDPLVIAGPSVSKQSISAKKRSKRQKAKCYRELEKFKAQNDGLKNSLNALKKRFQRLASKSAEKKTSFEIEADNLLAAPDKNKLIIKQKLITGAILTHQVSSAYRNCGDNGIKHTLGRIFAGKVVKKYRKLSTFKKIVPIYRNKVYRSAMENIVKFKTRAEREKSKVLREEICQFYTENSTVDPSKRGCRNVNGQLIPRRFLNGTILDLYWKFSSNRSSNAKVCFTTFFKYKPVHCVPPQVSNRDTCACRTHQNFQLLISALHSSRIIHETSSHQIIQSLTCNDITNECLARTCNDCQTKEIKFTLAHIAPETTLSYKKWVTGKEQVKSGKTGNDMPVTVTKKKTFEIPLRDVDSLFKGELREFMLHEMRIHHQYHQLDHLKKNLTASDFIVIIDFSENYVCKYGTEVQGVHFGASRQQITLHTGYAYHSTFQKGFCTVSPCNKHGPAAIIAHLKVAFEYFAPTLKSVRNLHLVSDGPTTQYRNQAFFHLVSQYLMRLLPSVTHLTYNFSVAGHGKSPCDGMGAVIKKRLITVSVMVKISRILRSFTKVCKKKKQVST